MKRALLLSTGLKACGYLILGASTAWAQTVKPKKPKGPPKWTVEFHGGASAGKSSSGGTPIGQFPLAVAFVTQSDALNPAMPTRSVSSWMFGDGAALFNEVNAAVGSIFGQHYAPIVPLDATLRAAGASRGTAVAVGARLSRQLSPRIDAEFSFDRSQSRLTLAAGTEAAINATRSSFVAGFDGLLRSASPDVNVSATATLPEESGHQTALSGVLNIKLRKLAGLTTHVTGGMAVVHNAVNSADVEINGTYKTSFNGLLALEEFDTVTMHFTDKRRVFAGILGGGLARDVSARGAFHVDARLFISQSGLATSVDAAPSRRLVGPFNALHIGTSPSLQFSNQTGTKSSLSGPAVTNLTTFTGTGVDVRIALTAGYSVRF